MLKGLDQASQATSGAVALASAGGAWLAIAKEWVLELFGVPLPVLLAAAAGAFGARSYMPSSGLLPALLGGLLWTVIGAFGSDGARALLLTFFGVDLPSAGAPFAALVLSGLGQLLITKEMILKARAALGRRLDSLWAHTRGDE